MTGFIDIEIRKPESIAWLRDHGYLSFILKINEKNLLVRIENDKKEGLNSPEKEEVLKALEDIE